MHYYVTYTPGGKVKKVHHQLLNKQQVVDYEHRKHLKCIIFFQDDSIYDDWFKGFTGSVWRSKAEQRVGIEGKFDKFENCKEIEEEWIEDKIIKS